MVAALGPPQSNVESSSGKSVLPEEEEGLF